MTVTVAESATLSVLTDSRSVQIDDRDTALGAPDADGLVAIRLEKGRHRLTGVSVPNAAMDKYSAAFAEALTSLAKAAPKPAVPQPATPVGKPLALGWEFAAASAVNDLFSIDVDADGKPETILGVAGAPGTPLPGRVCLLDSVGTQRWSFATEGAVNAIGACDLDGDGQAEVVAGGEDAVVYCLSAAGQLKWKFPCPPVDSTIAYMHFGGKGAVKSLWAGALETGAKPLVIACPQDGYVFGLNGAGEQLWKYRCGEGVFTSVAVADLEGKGQRKFLGGSALCSWCRVTTIGADGKGRDLRGLDGWAANLTALAAGDTDGDGRGEIAVGTSKNKVYLLNSNGDAKWNFTLGEVASCMALTDLDGDGKQELVVGSPSFYLYALSRDGKLLWSLNLGAEVTALSVASTGAGTPALVAGTKSGSLYQVSPAGQVLASLTAKGQVTRLAAVSPAQPPGPATFVFGTTDGQTGALVTLPE